MGLDRTVRLPAGSAIEWAAVRDHLRRVGEEGALRMIDGLPAFPDETPEPGWRELRVAAGGGMVTVSRAGDAVRCVVWSNADPALLAARDRVAWAVAAATDGIVEAEAGPLSAAEFARQAGIRPA